MDPALLLPALCRSHGSCSPLSAAFVDHAHHLPGPNHGPCSPSPALCRSHGCCFTLSYCPICGPLSPSPRAAATDRRPCSPPPSCVAVMNPAHLLPVPHLWTHLPPGPWIGDPAPLPRPVSQPWIMLTFSQCRICGPWSPYPRAVARDCRRPRTTADNHGPRSPLPSAILPQHGSLTREPMVTGNALQRRPDIAPLPPK